MRADFVSSWLFAAAFTAGCRGDLSLPEPPAATRWLAAAFEDERGDFVGGTAVHPYAPGGAASFAVPGEAEVVRLLGWESLEGLRSDGEAEPGPGPLDRAEDCAPQIRRPSFLARVGVDGQPRGEGPEWSLTAPWIDACGDWRNGIEIDVRCIVGRCEPVVEQDGCRVTVDLRSCYAERFSGQVSYDGRFCPERLEQGNCAFDAPQVSGAQLSLDCRGPPACTIHVYPPTPPPAMEVAVLQAVPSVAQRAIIAPDMSRLNRSFRRTGYFTDFLVLDDRVLVASLDGRYQSSNACDSLRPGRIYRYDPRSLAPLGSTPSPPCLQGLLREPNGPRVVGVFGRDDDWHFGFFDQDGTLTSSVAVELPPGISRFVFADAAYSIREDEILFAFISGGQERFYTAVIALRAGTAPTQRLLWELDDHMTTMDVTPSGLLAVGGEELDFVHLFDLNTEQPDLGAELNHLQSAANLFVVHHKGSDQFLIPVPIDEPVIYSFRYHEGVAYGVRGPVTQDHTPYALTDWPGFPELVLVATIEYNEERPPATALRLYEVQEHRFLPGSRDGGYGLPSEMRTRDGFVWVAYPWEGTLWRIRPL